MDFSCKKTFRHPEGKPTFFPNLLLGFVLLVSLMMPTLSHAQAACSDANLFQKYWQYKKQYERTFIVNDRDPVNNCVNDGIGFDPNSAPPNCLFSKQGYGLPATNLLILPNGSGAPGAYLNQRYDNTPGSLDEEFYSPGCSEPISWGAATNPEHKFNIIDFGSETLTQLGWHFTVLATEYELLGRSGQVEQQQKVLEDIFLGLQAIRRLDMQAQCMLKEMYDNRSPDEELMCEGDYVEPNHIHFDSRVKSNCNFTPDFSGYNGFFLRCDAAQNLEDILHDPSDETYHVDAVGGAFGGLNNGGANCEYVDPFCWMVHTQHFISHDQLINLFYGFMFIHKYIPETATVTTCDGTIHHPIDILKNISNAIRVVVT